MLKIKNVFEDFQYVVERKKPEKICFGLTGERDTSIIPKRINQVSPASYELNNLVSGTFQLLNKGRSRKGVGGLASDEPRFRRKILMQIPSPTRYDLRKQYEKKQYKFAAFGTNSKRMLKVDSMPGPGTYKVESKKCRRTKVAYNFGRSTMIPSVKVNCQSRFTEKCDRCGVICKGDYWERNHLNCLCHICWTDERYAHEMFNQKEIKQFKKIRTCEFKHNHNGTTAAVRLLTDSDIKKHERLENYLDLFISC